MIKFDLQINSNKYINSTVFYKSSLKYHGNSLVDENVLWSISESFRTSQWNLSKTWAGQDVWSENMLNRVVRCYYFWYFIYWAPQCHNNTAAVTWRFSSGIPRLSKPYLCQERSSPIVWGSYFWHLDLQSLISRKKSFSSFLALINVM